MNTPRPSVPIWFFGVLFGALLIFVSIRGQSPSTHDALQRHFALQPTPVLPDVPLNLPALNGASLPPEVQAAAEDLQRRLGLGQRVPALTPVANSARLRVEVREVQRVSGGVRVMGSVTNTSSGTIDVPVSTFQVIDSSGASYAVGGNDTARLDAGASTPLDLTVPLPDGKGLLLRIVFPPDAAVEQVLLVERGAQSAEHERRT